MRTELIVDQNGGAAMTPNLPNEQASTPPPAAGITRRDHVLEIPQRTYHHGGFTEGEVTALVDNEDVTVRISTIDGDMTLRVPVAHLGTVADLLAHIRDDQ